MTDAVETVTDVKEPKPKRTTRARKTEAPPADSVQTLDTATSAEQPTSTSTAHAPAPARKPVQHSQPVYLQKLSIQSLQGQRVMDRSFRALAGSLFRCEIILRIVGDEEAIDLVESQIAEGLAKVRGELDDEVARAKSMMQAEGIDALPEYSRPKQYNIQIKTQQIANFSRLVANLDELISYIDALWLMGAITPKERSQQTHAWQQRLIKMANQIINLERRARAAAYRKGMTEEVEEAAPESDLEADEKLLTADDETLEDTSERTDEEVATT